MGLQLFDICLFEISIFDKDLFHLLLLSTFFCLQVTSTCIWKHQVAFHPVAWLSKYISVQQFVHIPFFLAMETMLSLVLNS